MFSSGAQWVGFALFTLLQIQISAGECDITTMDDECNAEVLCHKKIDLNLYYQRDKVNQQCLRQYAPTTYNIQHNQWNVKVRLVNFEDPCPMNIYDQRGYYNGGIVIDLELEQQDPKYIRLPTFIDNNNIIFLKSITMTHNVLTEVNLFNSFEINELEVLDLSHNLIKTINSGNYTQHPYVNLKVLNLSNNDIVNISEGIFHKLINLHRLDLSHNLIDIVNIQTFKGLDQLQYLDLSFNRIQELNLALTRFAELTTLYLNDNKITSIKTNSIKNLTKLTTLRLQNNAIVNIESNSFSTMTALHNIDISNNAIEEIHKQTFLNNSKLSVVDMSNNKIKQLPKALFKNKTISTFSITSNFLNGNLTQGMLDGLALITNLDLSYQQLTTIGNYAFLGLKDLKNLLLNNNKINLIQDKSFKTLDNLIELNLAHNELSIFTVCKDCLPNLEVLILNNNFITQITKDELSFVNLGYLNIENNNITGFGEESFIDLHEMTRLEASHNPLSGDLEAGTFAGLVLLPFLDISNCNFITVKNNSFNDLTELKKLNLSHNKIETLEYNSFMNLENLEILDLSGNHLKSFEVNNKQIINLKNLILGNNNLETITVDYFKSLLNLKNLHLNNNNIKKIHDKAFKDQTALSLLDITFNENLTLHANTIDIILFNLKNLDTFDVSGNRGHIGFTSEKLHFVRNFIMKKSLLANVTSLELYNAKLLQSVVLSYNNVTDIEYNAFQSLINLEKVDLSFNNINYVQPGTFKDNVNLKTLSISNNKIATLNFGMFRGLSGLNTLDLSYNLIDKLTKQQFHELSQLKLLLVDHNEIGTFNSDILRDDLLLSIGENPLPCETIVTLDAAQKASLTAIHLNFMAENVDGITCNRNSERAMYTEKSIDGSHIGKLLTDIKDILKSDTQIISRGKNYNNVDTSFNVFFNISKQLTEIISQGKNNNNISKQLTASTLENIKQLSEQKAISEYTNSILEKIFKQLTQNKTSRADLISTTSTERVYAKSQYNDLKAEFEILKQKIENEIYKRNLVASKEPMLGPKTEFVRDEKPSSPSMAFTNTCTGLILLIILCCVIYFVYKTNKITLFRRNQTLSSRQINDSMESPNL